MIPTLVITKYNLGTFAAFLAWAGKQGCCSRCKVIVATTLTAARNPARALREMIDTDDRECDYPDCRARFLRVADLPKTEEEDGNVW